MIKSITSFIVSDSSALKAFVFEANKMKEIKEYPFSLREQAQSSTFRETLAVHKFVCSNTKYLSEHRDSSIIWLTDNQPLVSILKRGSRIPALQTLILDIKEKELQFNVTILPIWHSRNDQLLVIADAGSKHNKDTDEWQISKHNFENICTYFKIYPDIDLFASHSNAKCNQFYSKLPCPYAIGVDCFIYQLRSKFIYWACPPVALIPKTLHFILSVPNVCTLFCIPHWIGSVYWPLFVDGDNFKPFIKGFYIFNADFIAESPNCVFSGKKNFNMICFYVKS